MSKKKRPDKKRPEAATARRELVVVLLVFFGALALRLVGLSWGIPSETQMFSYHPDEIFVLFPTIGMLQGDWNPHFFNYGTLYIYLVGTVSWIFALVGLSPTNSADLGMLHLIGRGVTAAMGAATIVLIYLIARKLGTRRLASIAAALAAIVPLHLINSHFATVDVPGTFFLVLAAYASLRIIRDGSLVWYLAGGAAAGLAAATKYNFGAGIVMVVAAHLLRGDFGWRRQVPLLLALVALPVFFLIGCPYAISFSGGLHLRDEFLRGLLFETQHMREVRTAAFVGTGSGWGYHLIYGLPAALGIPLYLFALAGILYFAVSYRRLQPDVRKPLFLFLIWIAVYLVMIGFATERFIRYLVPLVPFFVLFAAWFAESLTAIQLRTRKAAAAAGIIVMGLTILYSLMQLSLLARTDPRYSSLSAIRELRPQSIGLQETPWFRTPPISPYNGGKFSEGTFGEWKKNAPYEVVITGWNKQLLQNRTPDLYVISDLQYRDALRLGEAESFLRQLDASYEQKRVFRNPDTFDWLGGGNLRFPPDWLYLKPEITLYFDRKDE